MSHPSFETGKLGEPSGAKKQSDGKKNRKIEIG